MIFFQTKCKLGISSRYMYPTNPFQEISALENSLDNAKDHNESLQNQLEETRLRELDDAETSVRLHQAEDEVEKLKQGLSQAVQKEKVDLYVYLTTSSPEEIMKCRLVMVTMLHSFKF